MRTTRALAALTLGLSIALSACGTDDSSDKADRSTTKHNDADVAFANGMIPHHAQALSMADMTMDRELDPKVSALVEDIRAAQGPEIETMTDWLTDWDEEIPETMRDHVNSGHGDTDSQEQMEGMDDMGDMGDMGDMPGMMSAQDMSALEEATGADFQQMWLEMMVEHHEGAVEMAETEKSEGQYQPAVDLAEEIISAQESEIAAMENLLS
ncbi:MAG: DUF305 domain-containing protein [Nocardioides sp.]|nr:DUF305 domain-containing protein [Nocardioides sp.]